MEHLGRETDAHWFDTSSAPGNQHLLALFPDRRSMSTLMLRVQSNCKRADPDQGHRKAAFFPNLCGNCEARTVTRGRPFNTSTTYWVLHRPTNAPRAMAAQRITRDDE
jgi:hypothetical protein